jgi:acyl-CoA thioesterase
VLGDPLQQLASATAMFATPIRNGACVADVHVIRRGKSASQVRVALKNASEAGEPSAEGADDNAGIELISTWVRDRKGPDVRAVTFPNVKSVADSFPVEDGADKNPHTRFRFYHQLETRLADGPAFWSADFEAGPARYARWFRYRVPQRDPEGRFDRLALAPLIDTMPTALHRAIGPGTYRFYAPSLDLTVYAVDDTDREWLLVAVTTRRARAGYAIADVDVWDDLGRYVAYGSQAMYLQSVSGEPPIVDASRRT